MSAAPTISGTLSDQTTTSETPINPFSGATVGDANVGATDTLTITLSNEGAGGTLTDGTGFSGLVSIGAGVYTLTGTAAAITSELDALVFTPTKGQTNTLTTTTFTLSDVSSAYGTTSYASTPTLLTSFDESKVALPMAGLMSDAAGDLFGTTRQGGDNGYGSVFEIPKTPSGYGSVDTLVSFDVLDGEYPEAGLISDANGDLFGTTAGGGRDNGFGTVFEIPKTSSGYGPIQTLVSFNVADFGVSGPGNLQAGLTSDAAGDLFGTSGGGASGWGTVFEIPKTPDGYGLAQILASFDYSNGGDLQAGLISDANGDLFGTTNEGGLLSGGASGQGTVFEIPKTASGYGPLQTLVVFGGSNGARPEAGLISDVVGDLFGTTTAGGLYEKGTVFEIPLTSSGYGPVQILLSFNGSNGVFPSGGLIIDGTGDLLGTTVQGGASYGANSFGYGAIFEIPKTSSGYGPAQILLSFSGSNNGPDGAYPYGDLISDGHGDLFGTTAQGGAFGNGAVFELPAVLTPTPTVDSTTVVTNSDPASDDTPTLTVPGTQTVTAGQALELFGAGKTISIADPDAGPGETFTLEITIARTTARVSRSYPRARCSPAQERTMSQCRARKMRSTRPSRRSTTQATIRASSRARTRSCFR
jgi:uncharacterized repeat protein (TIGR03803 family)